MSTAFKAGPPLKQGHSGLAATAPGSQFNRRSTPDSEALASSDDEVALTGRPEPQTTVTTLSSTATISAVAAATTQSAASALPTQGQPPKPIRRASWLNDTSQSSVRPRNDSYASSSMSPTASHPNTPSFDATATLGISASAAGASTWGTHVTSPAILNRGTAAFHWGSTSSMWNTNTADRKDHTSRRSDVLPSPTSVMPPGSGGSSFFNTDPFAAQTTPASRDSLTSATSQIPFAIPLHPTPKTYRSQSYSVGQLDPDSLFSSPAAAPGLTSITGGASLIGSRPRPIAGLQHRPSRPSMLSEMSNDGGLLGKVREVEDDGDEADGISGSGSLQSSQHSQHTQLPQLPQQTQQNQSQNPMQNQSSQHLSAEAKTIEILTRENALLRQQQQQYHSARIRPRSSTAAAYRLDSNFSLQDSSIPPDVSDYAIDEMDEINDADMTTTAASRSLHPRRMSEFAAAGSFRSPFSVENRKLESVKKASWQSSPIGGGLSDASPSRRHSFADAPTRQASISSINEVALAHEANALDAQTSAGEFGYQYADPHSFAARQAAAAAGQSIYANGAAQVSAQQLLQHQQQQKLQQHQQMQLQHQQLQHQHQQQQQQQFGAGGFPSPYNMQPSSYSARPASPQRGMYGMTQPNRSTPLYIVLFKCARADVFYIQEGTGLTVKPGDLVIVEADRGTDLGTVAVEGIDWVEARRQKEHYAEEQYKWLMMYSQNAAAAQESAGAGLLASASGLQGSAVGGMGPAGQGHVPEPSTGELKPKLIKRLAQNHEVQALRDKEGNEAKAKRVCMQKVKEHSLNMEILDAEFQMDWKKLTFYYFADAYINFNSLVTDLFKIYKTRIWMSAINPASFASQPLGLQAPSGIGPGAIVAGRAAAATERRATQPNESQQAVQQQSVPQQQSVVQPQPPAQQQPVQQPVHQIQPAYATSGFASSVSPQPPSSAGIGPPGINNYPQQPFAYNQYATFGSVPRASGLGYTQAGMTGNAGMPGTAGDAYGMGYSSGPNQNDYQMMRSRFPNANGIINGNGHISGNGNGQHDGAHNAEWLTTFQGLSLR